MIENKLKINNNEKHLILDILLEYMEKQGKAEEEEKRQAINEIIKKLYQL